MIDPDRTRCCGPEETCTCAPKAPGVRPTGRKTVMQPKFADVDGTNITAETWAALIPAEQAVAAVVAAARRRDFVPEDDAHLVRNLTVAAHGEIVPRARPHTELFDALWSVFSADRDRDPLWGVLWDDECKALSFVPVGAPIVRCTNVWFNAEHGITVETNNGPAGVAPALLWASDDEVAAALADWCGGDDGE